MEGEGQGEGEFLEGAGVVGFEGAREEEAAGPEGGDGDEGAEPEEGLVGREGGGAEGEEDGVACGVGWGVSFWGMFGGAAGGGVPVCIEAKVPVALKATLSQRPETRQLMRSGQSAWVREMSSRTWASQPRRRGFEGGGDEAWWAAAMEAADARSVGLDGFVMFGVLMPELGRDGCGVSRGVAEAMVTGISWGNGKVESGTLRLMELENTTRYFAGKRPHFSFSTPGLSPQLNGDDAIS